MNKKNGGPAFPQSGVCTPEINSWDSEDFGGRGLTVRDYFAAKAMQGLLANTVMGDASLHERAPDWLADISVGAYEFADAMLRAREAS